MSRVVTWYIVRDDNADRSSMGSATAMGTDDIVSELLRVAVESVYELLSDAIKSDRVGNQERHEV